jgi:hypothetical protein
VNGRRRIIGVALLLLALLAGCSALNLGYRQAPALAHWWLDGYVDFDDAQSVKVKAALGEWHGWHRQTQLRGYADHLAQARALATGTVTAEQVCQWSDAARGLLEPAIERALPSATEVVLSLTPQQLRNIDAQYRKRTERLREEWQPDDPAQRLQASLRRNLKRVEDFYGSATPEQRQLLEAALRQAPVDPAAWLVQRELRHRELMDTLAALARDKPAPDLARERLRAVVYRFNGRAPVGGAASAAATLAACDTTARLHNASTPSQRKYLADKLGGWERDLRALLPEASASAGPGALALKGPAGR